ncbi:MULTISPECIES: cupin domain-containing protein [Achromobacter]|uniref:cupin domain-containing protein n=1 Tax=Achromobacter TaxID=222 RepID=UPI001EF20466|nr:MULTISPECIES: cupin domain-containing protein [Achromobacter]MCG7324826.1 cupin domain-containing protein [Achromobacter sp. ACRQX]MDH0681455.1 cupin domain-containing protein [Achromobacter animicus]
MALKHADPGQVIDLKPYGAALAQKQSVALFKSEDLEVMRLVLLAGKTMPSHDVEGEITLQCLEGSVEVSTGGATHVLDAGRLMYLPGRAPHSLFALENASVLVTVALKRT